MILVLFHVFNENWKGSFGSQLFYPSIISSLDEKLFNYIFNKIKSKKDSSASKTITLDTDYGCPDRK